MGTVTAGDHGARERVSATVVSESDARWAIRVVDIAQFDVGHVEEQRATGRQVVGDQILDQLGLSVDAAVATQQRMEVEMMGAPIQADVEAAVELRLAIEPPGGTDLAQQIDRRLFQDPGPDPSLHVGPGLTFQHHRGDALQVQQPSQDQPGRPGPDDRHLRLGGRETGRGIGHVVRLRFGLPKVGS